MSPVFRRAGLTVVLAAAGCAHDPSTTFRVDPRFGDEGQNVMREAYARWQACTPRLKPNGKRIFTIEVKEPEDGYADVTGYRMRIPWSGWINSPERRVPLWGHEMGHTWGIADLDTGTTPALMSKTTTSPVVTATDCKAFCDQGWCR